MDRPPPMDSYFGVAPPCFLMDTVMMTPFSAANNGGWTGDWTLPPPPVRPPLFPPYPPKGYLGNLNYHGVGRKRSYFGSNNSESQHSLGSQSSSFDSNPWSTRTPQSVQLFDSPKKNYPPSPQNFATKRHYQHSFGFFELSKYGNPIEPPCTRRTPVAIMPRREVNHNRMKDHGFFNGDTYWHSTYGPYRASGPAPNSERSWIGIQNRGYGGRPYVTQNSANRGNWTYPVFNGPADSDHEDASTIADKPHQTKQCVSDDDAVIDAVNALLDQMRLASVSGLVLENHLPENSVYNGGFPKEVHDSMDAPFEITKQGVERVFHHYTWKFSHEKVTVDGKRKVVVKSQMTGEYNFSDTVQLTVYIRNEKEDVKKQVFDLSKVDEQAHDTLCNENRFNYCTFEDLRVSAYITMKDFQYIPGDWDVKHSFYNPKRAHDKVLVLNGVRFYVHSHYLAAWSRYFDRIFFGDFKESGEKEVVINDVDPSEFDALLSLMHPNGDISISSVNVVSFLKLADRFEVPSIMARCGKFLADFNKCPDVTVMDRLEYADKFCLAGLQVVCFAHIRAMAADARFQFYNENRKRFRQLHHNTLKNLF